MSRAGLDDRRSVRPDAGAGRDAALDEDFSRFVQARTPALLRAAYLLTGDAYLAEDLVQSALARTHLSWRKLHHTGNAEAYTRKVMYHGQVSIWRRRRFREAPLSELMEPVDPDDPGARTDLRLAVRAALARLTTKQRAVLVLRYFEDRSEVETAELLSVSVGTVKSQTSYALRRLRALAPELAELANEVDVVDLEPQIRERSRRIRQRRTAAAIVAAIAAVAAMAGVILAIRPYADIPPAQPTPTPSAEPRSSRLATTMPRAAGARAAYGCPGVSTRDRTAVPVTGKLFFWTFDEATECAVLSRISSGTVTVLATVPFNDSLGPFQTVVLSPDATRIAWITNDSKQTGDLAVLTIGENVPRLIGGSAYFSGGSGPQWEPDSRHLLVRTRDDGPFRVDTTTGASQPAEFHGDFAVYSASHKYQAYWDGKNLVVARADGTAVHTTPLTTEFRCDCSFAPQSVSDDGKFVVLGNGIYGPKRVVGGKTIVDAASGQILPTPIQPAKGEQIGQVVFGPDGHMVVVTQTPGGGNRRVHIVTGTVENSQSSHPELTGPIVLVQN